MNQAAMMEQVALDRMEARWRKSGYTLVRHPAPENTPPFLRGLEPDAIAIGRTPGLVIQVVGRPDPAVEMKLSRLRSSLSEHQDWDLVVVYAAPDTDDVAAASLSDVDSALAEAEVAAEREPRSALLIAWSALEALARTRHPQAASGGLPSSTLLDLLVSQGDLPEEAYAELRDLARMRNALAHGGLNLRPEPDAVRRLVALARTLRPAA